MSRSVLGIVISLTAALASCKTERVPLATEVVAPVDPLRVKTSGLEAAGVRERRPLTNPFAGQPHAVAEGKRYYAWFNCVGCHGAIGGGSIGPPLADEAWIYGGEPEQIFASIVQGRPNGMPSYGGHLSDDVVWKLVAYVQTLHEEGADD